MTEKLLHNTTADKTLSQNYTMNVTEQGWAAYNKRFHDAVEEIAIMMAENQHDPAKMGYHCIGLAPIFAMSFLV